MQIISFLFVLLKYGRVLTLEMTLALWGVSVKSLLARTDLSPYLKYIE